MEDKTPMYMIMIVCIVALVAVIVMVSGPASTAGEGITANAAYEPAYTPNPGLVGKIFFTLALLGIAGYMYFRKV